MRPVILVILDGWGIAPLSEYNAIERARLPFIDEIHRNYFSKALLASGEAVGLPYGEMGNSEVGHLTIGLGRTHYQPFPRITKSILSRDFFRNDQLCALMRRVKQRGSVLHIIGLVSTGGVHGSLEHLFATIDLAREQGLHRIVIHAITDGRDAPAQSGINFIERVQQRLTLFADGSIGTITGRFFAMDRDTHWERTQAAFQAIVRGQSEHTSPSPDYCMQEWYAKGTYDEMIPPTILIDAVGQPYGGFKDGDAVIMTLFRPDRIRQLASSLLQESWPHFDRGNFHPVDCVTFTQYDPDLHTGVAFPPESTDQTLAQLVSEHGFRQLHVAETEKYAHVTYFINGYREQPFAGESRVLVPSPRVDSYAQCPQMAAEAITEATLAWWQQHGIPELTVINYANADMVGHTGDFEAVRSGVEVVDQCLAQLWATAQAADARLVITADHGNAEEMVDRATGAPKTYHTNNPVPVYLVSSDWYGMGTEISLSANSPKSGLYDVAPTILDLLGVPKATPMTGSSLLPS
ncbi:2,3-bisphosphoglycerate-independent phosphoglycerate mutase [Candidatus Uhrbacteria bacterium]|nr:2,3-bisphosphoglycerate-independent phosphoglycerate mutase [Candidatus Uhrbacteria bacterium]